MNRLHTTTSLVIALIVFAAVLPVHAQTSEGDLRTAACQIYRLTVDQGRFRSCPDGSCTVVGGATRSDALCIRGIAQDNPEWLIIDPSPTDFSQPLAYVSTSIVEPGAPGVDTSPYPFCDAYEVVASELLIRSCANQTCGAIGSFKQGEILCVDRYSGEYNYWYQIFEPATGITGWVRSRGLSYQYQPELNCADDNSWRVNTANLSVRSCSQITCSQVGLLQTDARVCVTGEAESEADWLSVKLDGGRSGWVSGLLVREVSDAELEVLELASLDVPGFPAQAQPTTPPLATITPVPTDVNAPIICAVGATSQENCITPTPVFSSPFATLTPAPTTVPVGPILAQDVTFGTLFIETQELLSPRSSTRFYFTRPRNWSHTGSNVLYLNLAYFENRGRVTDEAAVIGLSSQLDVRLNNRLISSINLTANDLGEQTIPIPLPNDLLNDPQIRTHEIALDFRARDHCLVSIDTRAVLDSSKSFMHFEYQEFAPALDLALYPQPLYNGSFRSVAESVLFVMPDNPVAEDFQALVDISLGLGLLSGNRLQYRVTSVSLLSEQDRTSNNLIYIGTVGNHALIRELYSQERLPTRYDGARITIAGQVIPDSNGTIQLAANPQNQQLTVMVVTSVTAEGIAKAGRALAGQTSVFGLAGPVIIVESMTDLGFIRQEIAGSRARFSELGFDTFAVVNGARIQAVDVDFTIPGDGQLSTDAYVDVIYNYSSSINPANATMTVLFNNVPIGSAYLERPAGPEAASQYRSLRAQIPPPLANIGGDNRISILVDMRGDYGCDVPNDDALWFAVSNESELYIPRVPFDTESATLSPLVRNFPEPFNRRPDLANLIVMLPDVPSLTDLTQMSRVLSAVASSTTGATRFSTQVILGGVVSPEDLADKDIIAIGRPSTNSFVRALNNVLPQPFIEGEDVLQQVLENVTYRLTSDIDLGLLQTIMSPWDSRRSLLLISGTSLLGQEFAVTALLDRQGIYNRNGNVVFVSAQSSSALNTAQVRDVDLIDAVIDTLENAEPTITPTPTVSTDMAQTPIVTVTPQPTVTLAASPTIGVIQPFITVSPAVTMTPSPIPTLALSPEALVPATVNRPEWVDGLVVATIVSINIGLLILAFRWLASRRRQSD